MKVTSKKNQGYSLAEAVIYIAMLSVFFVIIINSVMLFTKPYRNLMALRVLERSGLDSMERITRDLRSATYVDVATSTLGSNPGVLTLVSSNNGISTTTKFYVDDGVLKVDVNNVYQGPLSSSNVYISNIVFNHLSNPVSSAVKVDITMESNISSSTEAKTYHSTVILRGV